MSVKIYSCCALSNSQRSLPKNAVEMALTSSHLPPDVRTFHQNLGDLPEVHACPQRLPLVFMNLFDNAVRVMEGQGEIFISGSTYDNKVEIRVKDSGPESHQIFTNGFSNSVIARNLPTRVAILVLDCGG